MAIHEEVLQAARRIASGRTDWTFAPAEIVLALPHLNARSVRTHVVSRCCVNAPKHHPHRWGYFKRVARGRYQVLPQYRRHSESTDMHTPAPGPSRRVAEVSGSYAAAESQMLPDVINALVSRDGEMYVAQCLEIAVVTEGRTLDELTAMLEEAVDLHLEDPESSRTSASPRLTVIFEVHLRGHAGKA